MKSIRNVEATKFTCSTLMFMRPLTQGLDRLMDFCGFLLSFHVVGSSECLRGMLDRFFVFVFKVQKTMPPAVWQKKRMGKKGQSTLNV